MGFTGSYTHKLDSKGRVVLPAKFREELGLCVVAAIGIEPCVTLYSPKRWELVLDTLQNLSSGASRSRDLRRIILASAHELEIDNMGRILLPGPLRAHGEIHQDVVINGNGDKIEVWNTSKWEIYQIEVLKALRDVAEGIEGL